MGWKCLRRTRRAQWQLWLSSGLMVLGLGCTSVTELCACTYPPTAALQITGTVTRAGVPAPGVMVREHSYANACPASGAADSPEPLNVMAPSTRADANGQYRLVVRTFERPATLCVRLTASTTTTPSSVPVVLAEIERAGLRLRDSRMGGEPLDTIRVDFVLP
jgi:hypothetical protein